MASVEPGQPPQKKRRPQVPLFCPPPAASGACSPTPSSGTAATSGGDGSVTLSSAASVSTAKADGAVETPPAAAPVSAAAPTPRAPAAVAEAPSAPAASAPAPVAPDGMGSASVGTDAVAEPDGAPAKEAQRARTVTARVAEDFKNSAREDTAQAKLPSPANGGDAAQAKPPEASSGGVPGQTLASAQLPAPSAVYGFDSRQRVESKGSKTRAIALRLEPLTPSLPVFEKVLGEQKQAVLIGSNRGKVDVLVRDDVVSKRHVSLSLVGIKGELALCIVDHSTNGSYVNGQRLPSKEKRYRIHSGDKLTMKAPGVDEDFGWTLDFGATVSFFSRG